VSKRRVVRPRCDLAGVLLNPRVLTGLDGGISAVLKQECRNGAIRLLAERRTDFTFLESMADALTADGFSEQESWDALASTINNPAVVVRRSRADGRLDVLQATAVDQTIRQCRRSLIVLTAVVTRNKPPEVCMPHVQALPCNWDDPEELRLISERLEGWRRDYSFGSGGKQLEQLDYTWVWLGDPTGGYRSVPTNWEERVRAVGAVLGLHTLIARSPADAKAQTLEQRIHLGVMLNGVRGAWDRLSDDVLGRWTSERLGQPGEQFSELLTAVRSLLIEDLLMRISERVAKSRMVGPGEVVYHRKVSPQPKGYDRFDEGRTEPCSHGAESFQRWNGDKSRKGMARIYSNFTPDMLYHCSRYPNCGVYSIRG
jgi:hypothetical protein